jgi:hypothetical protein
MKFPALFLLALVAGHSAFAEDKSPASLNIRISLQVISVAQQAAATLSQELADDHKRDAAASSLQSMLIDGKARLEAFVVANTKEAVPATVSIKREIRFASEFNPGAASSTAFPEGFETRNTGLALKFTPSLAANGSVIELAMEGDHTAFKQFRQLTYKSTDIVEGKEHSTTAQFEQPEFATTSLSTQITLGNGQLAFLGAYRNPETPDRMDIYLLRAEIIRFP